MNCFINLFSEEPLRDKATTMGTIKVPENVEPGMLKRELAKKGYQVVQAQFHHNPITNERTGKGFVHVRAPNDRVLNEATSCIKNKGVKVAKEAKPFEENRTQRWRG